MAEVTISSKNQIEIPREAREALGVKAGDKVVFVVRGGKVLMLERPKSYEAAIRGMGRGLYPKDYLDKERQSWE